MNLSFNEEKLLKSLALSIVDNPRGTFKILAESVGISKATLHRQFGTRENLESVLMEKVRESVRNIIEVAENKHEDFEESVRILIDIHFQNKEFLRYIGSQTCSDTEYWNHYTKALDSFFLAGQKQGVFSLDFTVPVLTDFLYTTIFGVIESERKGRIASNTIVETIEKLFLNSALNHSK